MLCQISFHLQNLFVVKQHLRRKHSVFIAQKNSILSKHISDITVEFWDEGYSKKDGFPGVHFSLSLSFKTLWKISWGLMPGT